MNTRNERPEDEDPVAIVEVEIEELEEAKARGEPPRALESKPMTVGELVEGAGKALTNARTTTRRLVDQGRHRKVRITRNGKAVLPDIPMAAFAAMEVASFAAAGPARALAGNLIGRFLFDVEVVNEADKYFASGVERFLEGDLERAEQGFLKAVRIDDTYADAYLQLGVLYRMQGEPERARAVLERAVALDDVGEAGRKAGDILRALDGDG